jgi:hypothetical protein
MSGLAEFLADPARLLNSAEAKAPEPIALRRVAAKLEGVSAQREIEDVADLQARISEAALSGVLATLSRRDLREGCRAFLHPPNAPGRNPQVGSRLIDEVGRLRRRAALLALIDVYLDAFNLTDPDIADLGRRLAKLVGPWPWRETDQWPARAKTYFLFEPTKAPELISRAIFGSDEAPRAVLANAGLDTEGRRRGGMAEAAFLLACRSIGARRGPAVVPPQLRLIEWADVGSDNLSFPRAWPDFAGALFLPWRGEEPPAAHKQRLTDTALGCAGDPRVKEARWRPVKEANAEAYDVILRWLTKASVEQFFDIVSETMTDRPDMWEERRRFWTAYLNADLISEAWVVFGPEGAWRAQQAAKRSGDQGLSLFGRLGTGGGKTSEHAALIMRVGDLTVVEWSHNGSWNIWTRSDPRRPKLFRHNDRGLVDYDPTDLMKAPTTGRHSGDWTWRVKEIIRRETGLRP